MQVLPIANAAGLFSRPRKQRRVAVQETLERRYLRDDRDENAPRFVIYA